MDFTKAYRNILDIVAQRNVTLRHNFSYHTGDIETYIVNDTHNGLNIYLIVKNPINQTESLKSITLVEIDDEYFLNGYWPNTSFSNVYSILKDTNGSLTTFLQTWIHHMETLKLWKQVSYEEVQSYISEVSDKNNSDAKSKNGQVDLNIYPFSLKRRAKLANGPGLKNISASQSKKIRTHFGNEGLKALNSSGFTVTFTDNPLKQKTINLLDLPH